MTPLDWLDALVLLLIPFAMGLCYWVGFCVGSQPSVEPFRTKDITWTTTECSPDILKNSGSGPAS